jgi:hypothetical protein
MLKYSDDTKVKTKSENLLKIADKILSIKDNYFNFNYSETNKIYSN